MHNCVLFIYFCLLLKHFCKGVFDSFNKYLLRAYLVQKIVGDKNAFNKNETCAQRALSKAGFKQFAGQIDSTC